MHIFVNHKVFYYFFKYTYKYFSYSLQIYIYLQIGLIISIIMSYTFLCTFFSMKDCKIMTVCGFFCLLLILKMHSLASLISARFSLVVYWRVCAFLSVRFQFICVCCVCVLGVPRTGIEKFLSRHPDSCSHTHTHTHTHTHSLTYSSMQWATLIRIRVPREQLCAWGMFCTLGPGTDGPYSTANTLSLSLTHTQHTHTQRKREGPDCLSAQSSTSFCLCRFLSFSLPLQCWMGAATAVAVTWMEWQRRWNLLFGQCSGVCVLRGDETETPWLLWGRATSV